MASIVDNLPTEILLEIFHYLLLRDDGTTYDINSFPLTSAPAHWSLSRVCQRWRSVAFMVPTTLSLSCSTRLLYGSTSTYRRPDIGPQSLEKILISRAVRVHN
ncbi:hypothetical protein BDZ89DRAFT_680487 [Hymenopellis radicata]|nr:hypothetical protein BDZ89DRAFT_680487 [Hymenopellis radicata]